MEAKGEISDLEGYFCVIKYRQDADQRSMPRFVRISVYAYGNTPGQSTPIYNDKVTHFEVQLLSSIKVENKFTSGVKLNKQQRQKEVMIFSSSDFNVEIESEQDVHQVKHMLTRADLDSNQYTLTLVVPNEVTEAFSATIVLTDPYTRF